jgi:hypothetical protein
MLQYVQGDMQRLDQENSPARALLNRIRDKRVRDIIVDMTQRDPALRLSVSQYLNILQGKSQNNCRDELSEFQGHGITHNYNALFPSYFDSTLYTLYLKLHWEGVTPDSRVNLICQV